MCKIPLMLLFSFVSSVRCHDSHVEDNFTVSWSSVIPQLQLLYEEVYWHCADSYIVTIATRILRRMSEQMDLISLKPALKGKQSLHLHVQ